MSVSGPPPLFKKKKISSISPPSSIPPLETLKKKKKSYTHILLKGNPRCGITIMCSELCKNREQDVYYPRNLTNHTHTFYLRGIPVVGSQSCAANCAKIVSKYITDAYQSYTYILLKGNPRKRKPMPTNHTLKGNPRCGITIMCSELCKNRGQESQRSINTVCS